MVSDRGATYWSETALLADFLTQRFSSEVIVYGPTESERAIDFVVLVDELDALDELAPNAAVVLTAHLGRYAWSAEYALRKCWERAAACLIISRGGGLPSTVHTLAERLRTPIIITEVAPIELATAVSLAIERPELREIELLVRVAEKFAMADATPEVVRAVICEAIPGALVDIGSVLHDTRTFDADDGTQVRHRIPFDDNNGQPALQILLHLADVVPSRRDIAKRIAMLAVVPLTIWSLRLRTRIEREEQYASAVLRRLIKDPIGSNNVSLRAALGWPSEGSAATIAWSTESPVDSATMSVVGQLIAAQTRALTGTVPVRSGEHWFIVLPANGGANRVRPLIDRVSASVNDAVSFLTGMGCGVAEVRGVVELQTSLLEAEMACQVSRGIKKVVHAGRISPADLLAAASTTTLLAPAKALLARIIEADRSDTLLRTLAAYLDTNGSGTATAEALGVHRNTVAARIERISELGYDLSLPRERMGLFLAARVILGHAETYPRSEDFTASS